MPTRIKICGVREPWHIMGAAGARAHAVGLNFIPQSKRFVGDIDDAARLLEACGNLSIEWAGVFIDPDLDELLKIRDELKLGILQLHGDESPEFVRRVKARAGATSVWKAFRVATREDLKPIGDYECDGVLLDAKIAGAHGGTGHVFDWSLLDGFARTAPLILSGGLTPQNVGEASRAVRPDWVDVASGVESAPGQKDVRLIIDFVAAVNRAK